MKFITLLTLLFIAACGKNQVPKSNPLPIEESLKTEKQITQEKKSKLEVSHNLEILSPVKLTIIANQDHKFETTLYHTYHNYKYMKSSKEVHHLINNLINTSNLDFLSIKKTVVLGKLTPLSSQVIKENYLKRDVQFVSLNTSLKVTPLENEKIKGITYTLYFEDENGDTTPLSLGAYTDDIKNDVVNIKADYLLADLIAPTLSKEGSFLLEINKLWTGKNEEKKKSPKLALHIIGSKRNMVLPMDSNLSIYENIQKEIQSISSHEVDALNLNEHLSHLERVDTTSDMSSPSHNRWYFLSTNASHLNDTPEEGEKYAIVLMKNSDYLTYYQTRKILVNQLVKTKRGFEIINLRENDIIHIKTKSNVMSPIFKRSSKDWDCIAQGIGTFKKSIKVISDFYIKHQVTPSTSEKLHQEIIKINNYHGVSYSTPDAFHMEIMVSKEMAKLPKLNIDFTPLSKEVIQTIGVIEHRSNFTNEAIPIHPKIQMCKGLPTKSQKKSFLEYSETDLEISLYGIQR